MDALREAADARVHLTHPLGVKGFQYRRVKNDASDAGDLADRGCGCTVDAPRSVTACLNKNRPVPGTRSGTDDRSALSFSVISLPVLRCPRCTGTFRNHRDTSNRAAGNIATWMATAAVGEPGRVMATDLDPCFAPDDPRIQVRCHDIAAGSSRQGQHPARCGARRGVGRAGGIADREFLLANLSCRTQLAATRPPPPRGGRNEGVATWMRWLPWALRIPSAILVVLATGWRNRRWRARWLPIARASRWRGPSGRGSLSQPRWP